MNAVLLTEKPTSGTCPECSWASASRPNVWVRFDEEEATWIGIFEAGYSNFTAIAAFGDDDGRTVLVIAGGQGYIVDVEERRLVRRAEWEDAQCAATVPGANFVVVADCTRVWLETRDGEIRTTARTGSWQAFREKSNRLAMDGIVIQAVTPTSVSGAAWWMGTWHPFDLDPTDQTFGLGDTTVAEPKRNEFGGWPCAHSRSDEMKRYLLE